MSQLKNRIEALISKTTNLEAAELCRESLKTLKDYTSFSLSASGVVEVETKVSRTLIESLGTFDDAAVKDFVKNEKRINGVNNLGVREAIKTATETDAAKHPAFKYLLEKLSHFSEVPEYTVAHEVYERLKGYEFEPKVKEALNTLKENCSLYKEDINILQKLDVIRNSSSAMLLPAITESLDRYMTEKSSLNRKVLLETLSKHSFDHNIRGLYNMIAEADNSYRLSASNDNCQIKQAYSPVTILEGAEVFGVVDKLYKKVGDVVSVLSEEEAAKVSEDFKALVSFLAQDNVKVSENSITVFSDDKKVEIFEKTDSAYVKEGETTSLKEFTTVSLKVNGKETSPSEFRTIYMNSGMYRHRSMGDLNMVTKIVENFGNIVEIDFVKVIESKLVPGQRVDVFNIGDRISINKVNPLMKENHFFGDCNAMQSRDLVMEFLNYDLGQTFSAVLGKEEALIQKLVEKKKEYLDAITYLEGKTSLLESQAAFIRESEEVKQLLSALNEEIAELKSTYSDIQEKITSLTKVEEGFSAGDAVSVAKKKPE